MSLAKKISEDVKSALKGGDKKKLSIARYIYSELKNFLIKENLDRDVIKLSDENVIKIIKTQLKQKKESLEFASQAKVQSKIDDLEFDINYLNNFLPTLMDDDSTKNIILDHIKENNLENKDFGKIMGFLKQNYNNKIDMNLASKIIKHIFKE
jgi:uncharacterized protein YqeY|tara:strand:+ start:979 stop:1437 length:459 start_codon:yes stop_codon:yes gene_type:complete